MHNDIVEVVGSLVLFVRNIRNSLILYSFCIRVGVGLRMISISYECFKLIVFVQNYSIVFEMPHILILFCTLFFFSVVVSSYLTFHMQKSSQGKNTQVSQHIRITSFFSRLAVNCQVFARRFDSFHPI